LRVFKNKMLGDYVDQRGRNEQGIETF